MQQIEDRRRKFLEELLMKLAGARMRQLENLAREVFADTWNLAKLLLVEPADRVGPWTDRLGRRTICADLEGVVALDLEQVGDFAEHPRDGLVIHASGRACRCGRAVRARRRRGARLRLPGGTLAVHSRTGTRHPRRRRPSQPWRLRPTHAQ